MGVNLELYGSPQGDHATDLSTNAGYSGLCGWIATLPADRYPGLHDLADNGEHKDTYQLADELDDALGTSPPEDPAIFQVADRLADLIGGGYREETTMITD